jgi:hypothetical protein
MPSAKRRFDRGPVSLTVINRHNKHTGETWHDVKARERREQRPKADRFERVVQYHEEAEA